MNNDLKPKRQSLPSLTIVMPCLVLLNFVLNSVMISQRYGQDFNYRFTENISADGSRLKFILSYLDSIFGSCSTVQDGISTNDQSDNRVSHAANDTAQFTNQIDFDPVKVLAEVANIVADGFYDPDFDHEQWKLRVSNIETEVATATTRDEFADHINQLLHSLNTSHTAYFAKSNPKRYQILGIFQILVEEDTPASFVYPGVGIDTQLIDNRYRVTAVFDGFSAANSGVRFGDELISVDDQPFHPIDSFVQKQGTLVTLELKRGGETKKLQVEVQELDGRTMFTTALNASQQIFQRNGKKIGYLHAWSYAGSHYHDIIRQSVLWEELSQCDALVLDLRDGWGGADLNYLNLFRTPIAEIKSKPRSGPPSNFSGVWGKPVVLLTNRRTTSGKELFAYGFKKLGLGKIIGEQTAGAVVAGKGHLLSNGDVLYLAVSDIEVDGIRLEGKGVAPDIEVLRPITGVEFPAKDRGESENQDDPQLAAALNYLSK